MTSSLAYNTTFECTFPDRRDWEHGEIMNMDDINIFTDGSKMECGTGAGVFSSDIGINNSIKLLDCCTVE